jgi:hypothetical protein
VNVNTWDTPITAKGLSRGSLFRDITSGMSVMFATERPVNKPSLSLTLLRPDDDLSYTRVSAEPATEETR